jgi:hypothetical protein
MPGGMVLGADVVAAIEAGADGPSVCEEAGSVPHATRTRLSPSPTGQARDLLSMPKVYGRKELPTEEMCSFS